MNTLIIGGNRFVGYQLAWRLIAGGHRVTLLNRGNRPDPFGTRVERLTIDRKSSEFGHVLQDHEFDAVIDFACYNKADACGIVDALRDRVGHYVMISTGQVYLVRQGCPRPAREIDYDGELLAEPLDPIEHAEWTYGIKKRQAEDHLANEWASSQFPSTRLRIPMVNGERDHFRRLEAYVWRMLDGHPLILPDGGKHAVRHVYSGSVVDAIVNLLSREGTFGRAYNLAQDETPTLHELVEMLGRSLGATYSLIDVSKTRLREVGIDPVRISPFSGEWMSFLDPEQAKIELGFAHTPLRTYIDRIVTCLLNHPPVTLPENYESRPAELSLIDSL